MPCLPKLPPPGTPIASTGRNSLRGVVQELAAAAQAAPVIDFQGPISAVAGPGGLQINAADPPRLAVFQVVDRWYAYPADDNLPQQAAFARAKPVYYFAGQGIWQAAVDAPETTIWHPCGYPLDSVDPARATPAALQNTRQFMPKIGIGQWCWCCFDAGSAAWQVLDGFEDIVRVRLAEDWYACGAAAAVLRIATADIDADDGPGFADGPAIEVYDPLGTIAESLLAVQDDDGDFYIPAGNHAYVKRFADDNAWEPLRFMPGDCAGSGSGGSGPQPPQECGVPCPPPGSVMQWIDVGGGCLVLAACTVSGGSVISSGGSGVPSGPPLDCGGCATGSTPANITIEIDGFTTAGTNLSGVYGLNQASPDQIAWLASNFTVMAQYGNGGFHGGQDNGCLYWNIRGIGGYVTVAVILESYPVAMLGLYVLIDETHYAFCEFSWLDTPDNNCRVNFAGPHNPDTINSTSGNWPSLSFAGITPANILQSAY